MASSRYSHRAVRSDMGSSTSLLGAVSRAVAERDARSVRAAKRAGVVMSTRIVESLLWRSRLTAAGAGLGSCLVFNECRAAPSRTPRRHRKALRRARNARERAAKSPQLSSCTTQSRQVCRLPERDNCRCALGGWCIHRPFHRARGQPERRPRNRPVVGLPNRVLHVRPAVCAVVRASIPASVQTCPCADLRPESARRPLRQVAASPCRK